MLSAQRFSVWRAAWPRLGRVGALCAALAGSGAANALGANLAADAFATADDVVEVIRCGQWDAPGGEGFYRVIHGERYAQSFLYVQKMVRSRTQGSVRAVETLPIAELNNDHADILLERLRCTTLGRGIVILARAHLGHEDAVKALRIEVDSAARSYRFRLR